MANNDRKQSSKFVAPRWGAICYVNFSSIVINLLRRYATKKYQEPENKLFRAKFNFQIKKDAGKYYVSMCFKPLFINALNT